MKQLKQDKQFSNKQKLKVSIQNPNPPLQTAKYLAAIILEELKEGERPHSGKDEEY
ncbi:hypothetical protein [Anaerocolumna xylanovorans]|uniref:hypothetical protein n=1 Tax=Anaerocolumna xylanovorans TaxID=100134 RepID=UPI0015881617|nr:hypothetical protein [Anaerocolumna xylanovorans]